MNKKEFLDKLEKKLTVLNEQEKQDIIAEYTDTINEKVKRGQTEEEAVKDFGNIDDLAKEILSAYKINPDYEDKEESVIDKGEDFIKKCASKIAEISTDIANRFKSSNKNIGLELVFEILIKVFIALILLLVFRGVFHVFSGIGVSLFNDFFSPVGEILSVVWQIFITIIYILVCILLVIAMFKTYFTGGQNNEPRDDVKMDKENDKNEEKKDAKGAETVKTVTPKAKKEKRSGTSVGEICLLIVKILVIIYVIIPFVILDCIAVISLVFSVIYWIKGIDLLGLTLGLAGLTFLLTYLIKLIFSLLFGKSRPHLFPVIISVVMMAVGGFMFADMLMSMNYYETSPEGIKATTETKEFTTDKKVFINDSYYKYDDAKRTVDNSYPDGKFSIKTTYNPEYAELAITQKDNYQFNKHCEYDYDDGGYYDYEDEYEDYQKCNDTSTYNYINIESNSKDGFNNFKKSYNNIIDNLKDKNIYDYGRLYDIKIEVIANEKTLQMIETR